VISRATKGELDVFNYCPSETKLKT